MRNSANVRAACAAAGVGRRTVYDKRQRDPKFAQDWDEALEEACDVLEAAAWKRASGGESDQLLIFLLKAHRPQKFRDRYELTGASGGPIRITTAEEMSDDDLAAIAAGRR